MCTLRSGSRKTPSLGLPRHPGEGRDDGRPPAVTKEAGADDCPGLLSRLRRPNLEMQNDCRSEEHTSELQSLMRISYAVFCLKKKNNSIVPLTTSDSTTHKN